MHRFPIDQAACTHGLVDKKERIMYTHTFTEGKACTCWKTKFWSMVFGPWYFGIWSEVLTLGIELKVSVLHGFDHGIERGLTYIRRRTSLGHAVQDVQGLNM